MWHTFSKEDCFTTGQFSTNTLKPYYWKAHRMCCGTVIIKIDIVEKVLWMSAYKTCMHPLPLIVLLCMLALKLGARSNLKGPINLYPEGNNIQFFKSEMWTDWICSILFGPDQQKSSQKNLSLNGSVWLSPSVCWQQYLLAHVVHRNLSFWSTLIIHLLGLYCLVSCVKRKKKS